ncbi:MAG: ATP-dependent zinc metalloprotease FtsH [Candidatus Dormibacteraeota bacterium]|nr:ATP-dependent zinc metalloprotease FtsH [Candidatus Dormibacteraeota bacterium]
MASSPEPSSGPSPDSPQRKPPSLLSALTSWRFWLSLGALLLINYLIVNVIFAPPQPKTVSLSYTQFKSQVAADNVKSIVGTGSAIAGVSKQAISQGGVSSTHFTTYLPVFSDNTLQPLLDQHQVDTSAKSSAPDTPFWENLLFTFGPTILIVLGFLYISRRLSGMAGGAFGFGQSRARLYDAEQPATTFADVAGIDEAEQELTEVVDFLRNPKRYQRLGGMIPKGVLLVGPPGTGKTLLARAVAGEAKVPFFSVSASEFVEMIVGVGASRVRDLFTKARAAAPAIIFIDELDAIGRSRAGATRIGGHDEQEQTLNQILTEMDGFDPHVGVIVLASTNRADVLDAALLRPGRFDRRVVVQPPDRAGREAILRIHTRTVPLDANVDLARLASQTSGLVGAELRNLVNEAALLAARRDRDAVAMADFEDSIEKVLLGAERKLGMTQLDKERVAYHEGGHALLGLLVPGADPVRRVTIVPRGLALGVTVQSPTTDRFNYGEDYLRARIIGALGGRAAEKLIYGVVSTGAESDLHQVTSIARQMVVRWGMSPKIGPLQYLDEGQFVQRPFSDETAAVIDQEVKRIADECLAEATALLGANRPKLDALAEALLREESLDEDQILEVTGMPRPPEEGRARLPAAVTATSQPD